MSLFTEIEKEEPKADVPDRCTTYN